ncbi:DNA adenine methylase [Paenibacillus psychroresistens]|uniref:DNA adenine methylase n=1 Tax=Paenibacillus psychroresistens TaxID=1778678 RepID=A0A6B8RJQ1_9BACL|nr:DNA adenine methylase [Paenibacillus psychroresistens]QGQ95845.1 DNA adenine methylase [Paenibacillus psychroresistens]
MAIPRILHYPGSKWSIADWIISHMPPHKVYLEPYFGSGAVLFNKAPSTIETINDIDGEIVNLFTVIRNYPEEIARLIQLTPYARDEYNAAHDISDDELERARRFLVRCWQAIRPKTNSKSGWRCRSTIRDAFHVKQWCSLPDRFGLVAERLKQVQIENVPAEELLPRYRDAEVLIFADPPYVLSTRYDKIYKNEMSNDQHINLLNLLNEHPGPVLLTGYENQLYDDRLKHWTRREIAGKPVMGQPRTEVLWINPVAISKIGLQLMF